VTQRPFVVIALFAFLAGAFAATPARADDPHTAPASSAGVNDDLRVFVPGAAALEGKIVAPCCWNQTVDIHGSEISNGIRREIRSRLRAGESADAIQGSLVERYGPKILAMQADSSLVPIAVTVLLGISVAGIAGYMMLKRWQRAGSAPKKPEKRDAASNELLDARLDAELKALDD
jgi:cytochrome c-type biogenesis protein CcmH